MRVIPLSKTFDGPEHVVRNLRYSPDGRAFAGIVGHVGAVVAVRWYDVAQDQHTHEILVGDHDPEFDCYVNATPDPAISPNLETTAFVNLYEDFLGLSVADFSSQRPHSYWLSDDEYVVPDEDGDRFPIEHTALAFGPASNILFAAIRDGIDGVPLAQGWDLESVFAEEDDSRLVPLARSGDIEPIALACSPDGQFVAVGTISGEVLLYNVVDHPKPRTVLHPRGGPITAVGFSTKGTRLTAISQGTVAIWDMKSGKQLALLTGDAPLTAIAYSPSAIVFAVSSSDGTISFRDAKTFAERKRYSWSIGGLHSVAFSPDRLTCVAGGENGRVIVWDLDH